MGHQQLQRVLVRMLYDDTFADAVRAAPDSALAGAGLTELEREQLVAVEPRALRTDPLRRRRTLRMLVDEYKISTTLALSETRSLAFAEGFFASPQFHEALMARAPLYAAYGAFLTEATRDGRLRQPQLAGVVALEAAMARCRRDVQRGPERRPPNGSPTGGDARTLRLAPGVSAERLAGHVIETIQVVEQYLFEVGLMPMVALCDDGPRVGALPATSDAEEQVLLTTEGTHVSLTYVEPSVHALLRACAQPIAEAALVVRFGARGVPGTAVRDALQTLVDEGLLLSL